MSTEVKIPQDLTRTQHAAPDGVKLPIYMDNHATTPIDPRVLQEMLPLFHGKVRQLCQPQPLFWLGR